MSITINIYYTGRDGAARAFADEMIAAGVVDAIRAEEGNLRYEYFCPLDDPETVEIVGYLPSDETRKYNASFGWGGGGGGGWTAPAL